MKNIYLLIYSSTFFFVVVVVDSPVYSLSQLPNYECAWVLEKIPKLLREYHLTAKTLVIAT